MLPRYFSVTSKRPVSKCFPEWQNRHQSNSRRGLHLLPPGPNLGARLFDHRGMLPQFLQYSRLRRFGGPTTNGL